MTFHVLRGVRAAAAVVALVAVAAVVRAPHLAAQAPTPAPSATPGPTPRGGVVAAEEVTVVTLDVVAVDGKSRPVFGLAPADFEVRVAGKIQTVDFFEAPKDTGARSGPGRSDSEERIAGTTTPFDPKGSVRHVLVWVDLEQLPRRTVMDTAEALHKAFDHAPVGRYGIATHFGGTSARVWDGDSVDTFLLEADHMSADVMDTTGDFSSRGAGRSVSTGHSGESPLQYESRKLYEKQLTDEWVSALQSGNEQAIQVAAQNVSQYLTAERRRVKQSVDDFRETAERFQSLEGPRHLFYVSEGFERVPGFNFLAYLKAEQSARIRTPASAGPQASSLTGRPGSSFPVIPGAPGSGRDLGAGRFVFDPSPLRESDELARWLATSGIIVHFLDPGSLGRELPSAADKYHFESTLRGDDAKNLHEAPMQYANETGGLTRLATNDIGSALDAFLDATAATYRIGVRLQGVDPKKTYSVRVSPRRGGVTFLTRSAYKPVTAPTRAATASLGEEARRAGAESRADDRRGGAARAAKKAIPIVATWKGKASTASPDPGKPFWKLEISIPHEELKFETESDAFMASVKIGVEAAAVDGPLRDATTDDWVLSYSGDEYKEARDGPATRVVTLQLPPGRYDLTVSVNDALAGTFGQTTLRVDAR